MNQPTIVLACPTCKRTCRTGRETRPGAQMRRPGCKGLFRFFVHGNGAVELRPVEPEPVDDEPATESRLPPRLAEQEEAKGTRTIFTSRRRNRPIGGYRPFEKSRSYIGTFAFWTILGLASLAAYWYFHKIDQIGNARGRQGSNAMNQDLEVKRKAHLKKQQDVQKKLDELKKKKAGGQPAKAKVEAVRQPGEPAQD